VIQLNPDTASATVSCPQAKPLTHWQSGKLAPLPVQLAGSLKVRTSLKFATAEKNWQSGKED
jgi:hypothetical protein